MEITELDYLISSHGNHRRKDIPHEHLPHFTPSSLIPENIYVCKNQKILTFGALKNPKSVYFFTCGYTPNDFRRFHVHSKSMFKFRHEDHGENYRFSRIKCYFEKSIQSFIDLRPTRPQEASTAVCISVCLYRMEVYFTSPWYCTLECARSWQTPIPCCRVDRLSGSSASAGYSPGETRGHSSRRQ